jgi:hypothetical protein
MLRRLIDYALNRYADVLHERFQAATVAGVTRGVEAGLKELGLDVPAADMLPTVRGSLTGPVDSKADKSPQPAAANAPPTAQSGSATPPVKRGPGRPRKYLKHDVH